MPNDKITKIANVNLILGDMLVKSFSFGTAKNIWLKNERGLEFFNIIEVLQKGQNFLLKKHHDLDKYPKQTLLYVKVNNYVCAVPYIVIDKNDIFLKTIYNSRTANKLYGALL